MKIFKNRHYGSPFPFPKLAFGSSYKKQLTVVFDESIRYSLDEDQMNVNKLFGVSCGYHMNNSDRIGFRYIPTSDTVEIVAYSHVNGERVKTKHIYDAKIGEKLTMCLYIDFYNNSRNITMLCNTGVFITQYETKNLSKLHYTLGLYFGGNRKAPHTIKIKRLS